MSACALQKRGALIGAHDLPTFIQRFDAERTVGEVGQAMGERSPVDVKPVVQIRGGRGGKLVGRQPGLRIGHGR